jgi:ATP-dependent Lon protease
VRGHAHDQAPELPEDYFVTHDIHLHVPSGAIPKDGPSAGITMATALMSLVTGRPVRSDTAMTGEITLTGQVLPIGGLKEKSLAAQGLGVKRVIAPKRNEADLDELPEHLTRDIQFIFVDEVDRVLDEALEAATTPARPAELPRSRRRTGRTQRAPAAARQRSS